MESHMPKTEKCRIHETPRKVSPTSGKRYCHECKIERGRRDYKKNGFRVHPDYLVWQNMKSRCCNKNNTAYSRYGGRGIKLHPSWSASFSNFIADMGPRPEPRKLHSIERIDNDGHYEPGNVRWATAKDQNRNTRRNHYIEFDGRRMSLAEYVEINGLKYQRELSRVWWHRIRKGSERLSLRKTASLSGLDLRIVERRVKESKDYYHIAAVRRSESTFAYAWNYYTIPEISILSGVSEETLRYRIYELGIEAIDAVHLG